MKLSLALITLTELTSYCFSSSVQLETTNLEKRFEDERKSRECGPLYRDKALKLIEEQTFSGLFKDTQENKKFEASSVAYVNQSYWVVFDSLNALGKVDEIQFWGEGNELVGEETGTDSQFEGLGYDEKNNHFYLLQESIETEEGPKAIILEAELTVDKKSYDILGKCVVNFVFEAGNKGLEGMHIHEKADGTKVLFGMCEGNYCKGGKVGKERGNGRILVAEQTGAGTDDCVWEVKNVVHLPKTAYFMDYSSITIDHSGKRIGVATQEDSALWVADLKDIDTLEWEGDGEVFIFPRDNDCEMIYCNIEGVEFVDTYRLVATSDRMKGGGKQDFRCQGKDQSIHFFQLPK